MPCTSAVKYGRKTPLASFAISATVAVALTMMTVACSDDNEADLRQDALAYIGKTGPALGAVADSYIEWQARSAERSRAISNLLISRDPDSISKAIEAENEALATAHKLVGETLAEFRTIVPPEGCEEAHRLTTESLFSMEQGLKALYEWLTGPPDSDRGQRGFQLLEESASLNEQSDSWLARCISG